MEIAPGQTVRLFAARGKERARILAFHGGGGVAGEPGMLGMLLRHVGQHGGITSAAASYRTLKSSPGATLDEMLADAVTALDWMCETGNPGTPIYLLGASFGGLLALHAALARPDAAAGLVLLNPVTDTGPGGFANRVVQPERHEKLSPLARFEGADLVTRLRCLILHGTADDVVPVEHSRRFAALWPDDRCRLVETEGAAHGYFNRAPHLATAAETIANAVLRVPRDAQTSRPPVTRPAADKLPREVTLLFGIGAQKAGTSWLYDFLASHPECHAPDMKELHYFDVLHTKTERTHLSERLDALRDAASRLTDGFDPENAPRLRDIAKLADKLTIYAAQEGDHGRYVRYLLRGWTGQPVVCDVTPAYSTLPASAFSDMESLGHARYAFMMRDPVDRMWSQIRMAVETKARGALRAEDFEAECLRRLQELARSGRLARIPRADYARTIRTIESVVPKERILYLFHEPVFRQHTADRICDFLGISRQALPEAKEPRRGRAANLPTEAEALLVEAFRPQYDFVLERFGDAVPDDWRMRVVQPPRRRAASGRRLPRAGENPRIAFLHIPKTAGQTIASEVRRVLGPDACSPVLTHTQAGPDAQMPPGYRFYGGHLDWVDLETLPEPRFSFTVLRDPRERIASFYFFLLREAQALAPEELEKPENAGKRRILSCAPDEYFFGGDRAWQLFVNDHYNNFYCNYFITRRIRGWRDVKDLSTKEKVSRALSAAEAVDRIYSVADLAPLEVDLGYVLGAPVRLAGNYKNAGPDAGRARRWPELLARFEDRSLAQCLEAFVEADLRLFALLEHSDRDG